MATSSSPPKKVALSVFSLSLQQSGPGAAEVWQVRSMTDLFQEYDLLFFIIFLVYIALIFFGVNQERCNKNKNISHSVPSENAPLFLFFLKE